MFRILDARAINSLWGYSQSIRLLPVSKPALPLAFRMAEFPAVPEQDLAKHVATFQALKPVDGFVGGRQAKALFLKSKLDEETLAQIW
jgi:hypothetical protein